jgi:hypothetical protein
MSSRNYALHSLTDAFGVQRWLSKIAASITLISKMLTAKGITNRLAKASDIFDICIDVDRPGFSILSSVTQLQGQGYTFSPSQQ